MRIGVFTNYHLEQVGGAEEALDRLASAWSRSGHDVVLFSSRPSKGFARRIWRPIYRQVRFPRPFSTRYGLSRYVRLLRREQAKRPMDVLLACDAYWAGHVARLFSQRSGVPYVVSSQGGDVMHGSRFLGRKVTRERIGLAIRDAHGLPYISSYIRRQLEALAKPRGILRWLPNGWPDEWSELAEPQPLVQGPYILGMGRLVELKGFQTLLDAYVPIHSSYPEVGLVIAGEGAYLPTLVEQAKRLGLEPRLQLPSDPRERPGVCFPGFIQGEAKRSLIRHAAVSVSPSIRQEPMSLVLFEALCCGVPVIGSEVGGTPDVVLPGVNGELFPAEDSDRLAACLGRLLADPGELQRLAQAAAPSVEAHRWSKVAQRYLELFEEVIEAANGETTTVKKSRSIGQGLRAAG